MNRFICIHGHFYQPPRENPWLEEIELQDSAYPYQNWNERICAECYGPNASSRILDVQNNIIDIVNNYARISFNFGPTLLSWMEKNQPGVYQAVLEADKLSQKYFSGHGAAIAQTYNHIIMPLANDRDKRTQILWGIQDFESRFKRKPEGMWLPETAVDLWTLEALVDAGIAFTILAPRQAQKVRKVGENTWTSVSEATLDPQHSYLCRLPSGREISIFFYDGPISQDVAFGGLLNNGETFAQRLLQAFPPAHADSRLVTLASDGETYGHHHRFGNMALSYCLHFIESHHLARLTIPAEYLERNPPEYEVDIIENSSWSCVHGVERWRSDCGCHTGGTPGWNQRWRAPLREALDWLRDQMVPLYENELQKFYQDPWKVRDDYSQIILDRTRSRAKAVLDRHALHPLSPDDTARVLKLLEMQRHAQLMYTSCGWFFSELSGIETIQIIQYAARAIQLVRDLCGVDLEPEFFQKLERTPGNLPDVKNGAEIYLRHVKPAMITLLNVGAHYAISSLFQEYPTPTHIYSYEVDSDVYKIYETGKQKLVVGKAHIRSLVTWEDVVIEFGVVHLGDYNVNCGVRYQTGEEFEKMHGHLKDVFAQHDIPEVIHLISRHFGANRYTLWDLFRNDQGKVLNHVFNYTLEAIEKQFREVYEHYYPLMQIRPDFRIPLPKVLSMTVEFILNRDLMDILERDDMDLERLEFLAREIKRWSFVRDKDTISYVASRAIEKLMDRFSVNHQEGPLLKTVCEVLRILDMINLQLDLWKPQNNYFAMSRSVYGSMRKQASLIDDKKTQEWVADFDKLGQYLKVKNR